MKKMGQGVVGDRTEARGIFPGTEPKVRRGRKGGGRSRREDRTRDVVCGGRKEFAGVVWVKLSRGKNRGREEGGKDRPTPW